MQKQIWAEQPEIKFYVLEQIFFFGRGNLNPVAHLPRDALLASVQPLLFRATTLLPFCPGPLVPFDDAFYAGRRNIIRVVFYNERSWYRRRILTLLPGAVSYLRN